MTACSVSCWSSIAGGKSARHRLPGTFLHSTETLAGAVLRSLRDKAGVDGLRPRQLHVFDDPQRDDRGWVLSVAHVDVVRAERIPDDDRTMLLPTSEVPQLPYDHNTIIDFAVESIRADYSAKPDPSFLLPDPLPAEPAGAFTILDLRRLHEAVTGRKWNADTFRRTMLPSLSPTGLSRRGVRGKPAKLYVRAS